MKITKDRLKQIIKEELDDDIIEIPGYGKLLKRQIKRKLAEMLKEAAEDALEGKYPHLDGGVIQALHAARKMKLASEDAGQILAALEGGQGELPSWWMSKVTIAADYLNKARDYLLVPSEELSEQ